MAPSRLLVVFWLLLAAGQGVAGTVVQVPSNSSLLAALKDPAVTTIVLQTNYSVGDEFASVSDGVKPIKISRNVTLVGAPGLMPLLDLRFQRSVLELCSTCVFTFENVSIANERRGNGASVDFFVGDEGSIVVLRNAYRVRLACTTTNSTLELINKDQRRSRRIPSAVASDPLQQLISRHDVDYQGWQYRDMVWLIDYAYDVPQSFQEGKGMVGGYTLNTINTTRLCQNPVPPSCLAIKSPDACVNDAIDQALAAETQSPAGANSHIVAVAVGIAVSVGVLALAGLVALLLLRRRKRRRSLRRDEELQQAGFAGPAKSMGVAKAVGSVAGAGPDGDDGIDPNADSDHQVLDTHGWSITAMCTTPSLGLLADTRVSFGKCLGAGSYGRVYRARWAGQDVAVKVIEHDSDTAAAVSNEVQLMMNFSHPNIVRAFHYITFTQVADPEQDAADNSKPLPSQGSGSSRLASSSTERHQQLQLLQHQYRQHQQQELEQQQQQLQVPQQPDLTALAGKYAYSATPAADIQAPSTLLTPPIAAPPKPVTAAVGSSSGWDNTRDNSGPLLLLQQNRQQDAACRAADQQQLRKSSIGEVPSDSSPNSSQEQLRLQEQLLQQQLQRQLHQQLCQASGSADTNLLLQRARSGGSALSQARQLALAHDTPHGSSGAAAGEAVLPLGALGSQDTGVALLRSSAEGGGDPLDAAQYAAERDAWGYGGTGMSAGGCSNPWVEQWSGQPPPTLVPAPAGLSGLRSQPQRPPPKRLKTWLVQEYCDGGTLTSWVTKSLADPLGPDQMLLLLKLLRDAAQGLAELHCKKVVHGDLNARNVLVRSSAEATSFASGTDAGAACSPKSTAAAAAGAAGAAGAGGSFVGGVGTWPTAKLADLGMSRVIKQHNTHRTTNTVGTMSHMPPELLRYGRMSPSVDVYAFGVMMWEVFTRSPAFKHLHYGAFFEHVVLRQARPPVPPDMPGDYTLLMTRCWETDPDNRPTAACVIDCLDLMAQARRQRLQQQQSAAEHHQQQPHQQQAAAAAAAAAAVQGVAAGEPEPPQQQVEQQLAAVLGEVQIGRTASWDAMGMLQEAPLGQWQGMAGWPAQAWPQSDSGQVGELS